MARPKILAVGERFNQPEWEPINPDSLDLRITMGLYNYGPRREFLHNIGIQWTHGINLLWPHPSPGEWDDKEALRVVEVLRPKIESYSYIYLFGPRVCRAFDVPYKLGARFGRFIPLPHPTGKMELWNKEILTMIKAL